MDHSFPLDIIVFAVIAAVLFFRLRKVLGERSDAEPPSLDASLLAKPKASDAVTVEKTKTLPAPAATTPTNWTQDMPDYSVVLNATAHHRMLPLAALDPNFQPQQFLQGARRAFDTIMKAFARDDLTALEKLLTPDMFATFRDVIQARQAAQQQFDLVVHDVTSALISDARVDGTMAYLSVDFTSVQAITLRNPDGSYEHGQDGSKHTLHERWVFSNDLKDNEIIWRLYDTDERDV